ncbi:alpha-ketoglutarate-dependent dioxygenase AlkB [Chitinophaga sp. MM2321]|uniref:alpha-ketoglutarate-dependent dioxygenase AlkB family protein n=1 Tax=Chitinophaga sp. MM2321 TaxID=3137178 RepID=UPI0032D598CC
MNSVNILPADGEAYFYPDFFSVEESDRLWMSLRENIQWKQEPVIIMGKEIMQPRLTAWYGDKGKSYSYTGISMDPLPWTEELMMIKERITAASGHAFNSALLNYYRDGNDSVGWHRDNEKSLGINPTIGSVSFGTPRTFHFRHYRDKQLKTKILLTHGSFLLMTGATQHNWLHSIQKEPKITGGRINITFRTITR